MSELNLKLEALPGRYAVCRLDADSQLPTWADYASIKQNGAARLLICVTRTDRELSIVIDESLLPAHLDAAIKVKRGFVGWRIAGALDFAEVGIIARLTGALAAANVPVFVISTFDTDALLVPKDRAKEATRALMNAAQVAAISHV